jgi:dTDP-4-amino-4,6-dideoxygalactose transaminase
MRGSFLQFSPPLVGSEEVDAVIETLKSNWLTTGPKTRQFEQQFAEYVQAPGGLALNSCTAGLHTALVALGIGPGDEVITTPITFAASVNVIEHVGAMPVLADVEQDTLNLDPARVREAITPRTKAIIPVHYAGHPVNLQAFNTIAEEHSLVVIEDAAHAVSAKYEGIPIGGTGNPTAFSFYATKNMTTGEGGMLTGTPELLERVRILSLHGMSCEAWGRYGKGGSWKYDVVAPGFKYNMTDIQASIGICQLRKLSEFQQRRRQVVDAYRAALAELDAIQLPVERGPIEHAWHLFVIRLREGQLKINRDQFVEQLTAHNIGTSVHFIPIHMHSFYRKKYGYRPNDFPVAYQNYQQVISLPLNPSMSEQDVTDVIEAVCDIVKQNRLCKVAA